MDGHSKLTERLLFEPAIYNVDITTDRTSDYRSALGYDQFVAHLVTATELASGEVATVQFMQATDSSGTGAKVLGSATTYTAPVAGGAADITAQIYQDQLDTANDFDHIAVKVTSDKSGAVVGYANLILGDPSYSL